MKIKKVEFKNFKCYPNLIIPPDDGGEFPNGLFLIQGTTPQKSNSFGKTSFVEGILFGFFGPQSISLSIDNLITFGTEKAEIKIIFELDGNEYMLHRVLNRSGKSGTQKLSTFIKTNGKFRPDNSLKIEDLLEIKREQAMKTVFVKQGEIEALATATPAGLRDLIIKLFRLDIIDYAEGFLRTLKSKNDKRFKEISNIYIPPSEIDKIIEKNNMKLKKREEDLKDNNKSLENEEKVIGNLPEKSFLQKLVSLKTEKVKINGKLELIENFLSEKTKALEISTSIEEKKIMEIIEKKNNEKEKKNKEIEGITERINSIKSDMDNMKGGIRIFQENINKITQNIKFEKGKKTTNCPTCTKEISYEEAQNIIKSYEEEIKEINDELNKKKPQLFKLEQDLKKNEDLLQKISDNIRELNDFKNNLLMKKEYQKNLKLKEKTLSSLIEKYDVSNLEGLLLKFSVTSIEDLRDKITEVEKSIESLNNLIPGIESDIAAFKVDIESDKKRKEQMEQLLAEKEELEKINVHIEKNKDLVKGFITEYMVEKRLISNIQYTTNKFLKNFTGNQYSNLNLYSVKNGAGIEIDVYDEYNQKTKEVKFLSGGDKVALGFALRMGISDLMTKIRPTKDSPKRNPKISFMILDEPLAALDESRRFQVLTTLENQKEFNQLFLITHTNIPEEINPHFIKISKNFKNGLSTAVFIPKENKIY